MQTQRSEYDTALKELETLGPISETTSDEHARLQGIICAYRMENPRTWWKEPRKPKEYIEKLLTFTWNSESCADRQAFKKGIIAVITQRTTWKDYYYSFEHEDTNIHCHAVVNCGTNRLDKSHLKSTERKYGTVRVDAINTDNGLEEYLSKENPIVYKPGGAYERKSRANINAVQEAPSQEGVSPPPSPIGA